jgi:hypothetical protein
VAEPKILVALHHTIALGMCKKREQGNGQQMSPHVGGGFWGDVTARRSMMTDVELMDAPLSKKTVQPCHV